MVKALNVIFGIGIAVVVYILILLGIEAFYSAPDFEDYCPQDRIPDPLGFGKCTDNMTVGECRASMENRQDDFTACQEEYSTASENYNRNFFIIASVLGVLVVIAAYFFMHTTNISAGIAMSGIVLIMWAFIRGWNSTDPKLKFVVGLVIAAIVIWLAVKVNEKLGKK